MPELRRFSGHNTILKAAVVAVAVLMVMGLLLVAVRADVSSSTTEVIPGEVSPAAPALEPGSPEPLINSPEPLINSPEPLINSPEPVEPGAPKPGGNAINSFEDCANAGFPIAESYPEQCFTPDGRGFTRQIG